MERLRVALGSGISAGIAVFANPSQRRVQAAFLAGFLVDTGLLVLVTVYVYGKAGPGGVAGVGIARMLASTAFGLLAAAPLARWRADRVLLGLAVVRGLAAILATAAIAVGWNYVLLFAVAALTGATDALLRPAQSTLLPALVRTPAELVRANVGSSTAEAAGTFGGPIIAALFLAFGAPAIGGAVLCGTQLLGALALSHIHFEDQADASGPVRHGSAEGLALAPGIKAIRRQPLIGIVILGFALQTLVRGMLVTLIVVTSVTLVILGEPGVGLLWAAIGLGGIVGIGAGLMLGRSTSLAFAVALACWGLPLVVVGFLPISTVAVLAFAVIGLSNALLDIVGFSLLQRGCRNDERAAVFALLEGSTGLLATIGCVAAPLLIGAVGARQALVLTGSILPLAAGVLWMLMRQAGGVEVVPEAAMERLRHVPAFRVLPMTAIERLVSSAVPVAFAVGDVLMAKGAVADRFLVIESGTVEVTDDGKVLNTFGAGAGIGEIALLRGGRRTATVTAVTPVTAQSFDAPAFLAAVSGPASSAAATIVMEERLARSLAAD